MIRLIAEDMTAYTFAVTALCGEVRKELLVANGVKGQRYMRDAIRKCVDRKLLVERKTENGKIIRLSSRGYAALSNISALKHHYEAMTDRHTFKNGPQVYSRRNSAACAILAAMNAELGTDNMMLTYEGSRGRKAVPEKDSGEIVTGKKIFTGVDHLYICYENKGDEKVDMDYPSFVKRIPANQINLFTSGRVKDAGITTGDELAAIKRSRAKGHIFGGHTGYAVYAMPTTTISTNEIDESTFGRYVSNVHRMACGRPPLPAGVHNSMNGNAVIICEDISMVQKIIAEAADSITLQRAFSHTYIAPMKSDVLGRITKDDWRKNILDGMYDEKEISLKKSEGFPSCCNAAVGGLPSIDMYAFDINDIQKTYNVIKTFGGLHIICAGWQKPVLEEIYKLYEKKVVIEAVD